MGCTLATSIDNAGCTQEGSVDHFSATFSHGERYLSIPAQFPMHRWHFTV